MYGCMYVWLYVCMYVYIYVCMYTSSKEDRWKLMEKFDQARSVREEQFLRTIRPHALQGFKALQGFEY